MAEWSEDHMAAIGPLKLNLGIMCSLFGQTGDRSGPVGGKGRTVCWKGRGVEYGKPAPPRL
jgi:hypothetical protein